MSHSFGAALRQWRIANSLSFRGAGKRFGVTGSYIFRLENGQKQPSMGFLSKSPDILIDAWRDQEIEDINKSAEYMKMRRREVEAWTGESQ